MKIEVWVRKLVKNWNFSLKSKFWSKNEILAENRLLIKIEILVKNHNFGHKSNFFLSKIKFLGLFEIVENQPNGIKLEDQVFKKLEFPKARLFLRASSRLRL